MTETYCGKTCENCAQKEILNCFGCKSGPGDRFNGDCTLADCCREKGHQQCSTCGFSGTCNTLRSKDRMPEYRLKAAEAEKMQKAAIAERAPVLEKWLMVLFWLIIPGSIASIMTNETVAASVPALLMPGQVLSTITSLAYGFILLRLSSEAECYRKSGICALVCGGAGILIACFSGSTPTPVWMLAITIPTAIVSILGEYYEFMAHSSVLTGVDNLLSDRWTTLWRWYIGSFCAMLGSILLLAIVPLLGLLVTLVAAIAMVVVDIMKLVFLYRTARVFKNYTAD